MPTDSPPVPSPSPAPPTPWRDPASRHGPVGDLPPGWAETAPPPELPPGVACRVFEGFGVRVLVAAQDHGPAARCVAVHPAAGPVDERALAAAAAGYLVAEMRVERAGPAAAATLRLPRLALWYGADFGDSPSARVNTLLSCLPQSQAAEIKRSLVEASSSSTDVIALDLDGKVVDVNVKIVYNDYNWELNDIKLS